MQKFRVGSRGGAGLVRAAGPITHEGMRELRAEVLRLALTHEIDCVLCDLSETVLLLSDGDWQSLADDHSSEHAVRVPVGYLVGGAAIESMRALCTQVNMAGRIALAFMTSQAAYRWLGVPAFRPEMSLAEVARG